MIEFIWNQHDSHSQILKSKILDSDKIIICAAYWRRNGLAKIKRELVAAAKKENVDIQIYVGLDEKITEISALLGLLKLSNNHNNINVKACWMQRKKIGPIFHSKVFYFSNGKEFTAIVGSANVTKNGLDNNSESSIKYSDAIGSEFEKKIQLYFKELNDARYTFDLDMQIINEYRLWDRHA